MRFRLVILFISYIVFSPSTIAQVDSMAFQQTFEVKSDYAFFTVDRLGQIIAADQEGEIQKYDAKGQPQFYYSNARLGQLSLIDATNPFNLLLYYEDFQTLIQLDRTLNERGRLDLRQVNLPYTTAVARSIDDNIWIYEDWSYQLKKIDGQGQIVLNSNDLRDELGIDSPAEKIWVDREQVYLYFPNYGLAVFSNFAQFIAKIPMESPPKQLWQDGIIFVNSDNQVRYYNLKTELDQAMLAAPETSKKSKDIFWIANKCFVQTEAAIIAFDILSIK